MKKSTLVLLCCSAFLVACDNSSDTTGQSSTDTSGEKEASLLDRASSLTSDTAESVMDSTKESASEAMDAAKEAATDAMAAGKDLKQAAVEGTTAAVEVVKETTSTAVEKTGAVIASVTGDDIARGESIYKKHCFACHGSGVAGSPKLGDKTAWSARISRGNALLTKHAIEGYKGETGYMPPKGGFMSLSDDEIAATVQYMVSQSQ
ncbi:MAG: c-type cytochrome [Gammaproteobacteria bacterium]|nr:c-type cytochrome [Gammaproteobacteria bacterium]